MDGLFWVNMKKFDKKSVITLVIDIVVIVGAVLVGIFTPTLVSVLPGCQLAEKGLQCGSCGGTRCVYSFFTGHFIDAFNYNQYFFFIIIFVLVLILVLNLSWLFKIKKTDKILKVLTDYRLIIALGILYALFFLLRLFVLRN